VHPTDDWLIDLAAGLLESDGRAALLDHLRACAPCEERFLAVYRGSERLALRPPPGAAASSPAAIRSARPSATPGRPTTAQVPAWLRFGLPAAAVAACAAAILLATGFHSRGPADGLDYWMPLETERVLLRSGGIPEDTAPFRRAIEAYAAHDAHRVIALLGGRTIPPAYEPLKLLLASALVAEGRNAEAQALLERLDTLTLPQPVRDRARFLLYVALERDGRRDEARAIAAEIASGTGEFAARARALLAGR
jgi:hypothetical protein